jgi:hypothetical protein
MNNFLLKKKKLKGNDSLIPLKKKAFFYGKKKALFAS